MSTGLQIKNNLYQLRVMEHDFREALIIYLKGFLMGCADSVPGVSGGTIALITGIYDRLISAITSLRPGNLAESLDHISDTDGESDILFLLLLGSGVFSAVLLTLNFVHFMISSYLVITYAFFLGLISASIITLKEDLVLKDIRGKTGAVAGFLTAFVLSGYGSVALNHGTLVLFLSGMIAVTAMVLPGISGSLILLIIGQYEHITGLVAEATSSVSRFLTSGEVAQISEPVKPLIIFGSGGILGLLTAARVVEKALEKDRELTMTFLVSMVAGSLRAPALRIDQFLSSNSISLVEVLPEAMLASLIGVTAIILIHRTGGR